MIPTAHTFYDTFAYKGKWWLPRSRKKIDGELIFKGGDRIRLELAGSLEGYGQLGNPPVIYGILDNGTIVTLLDNLWESMSSGHVGHERPNYLSNRLVFGVLADGPDDLIFHKVRLRLTYLESWAMIHPFTSSHEGSAADLESLSVTYARPSPITIRIAEPAMTIVFRFDLNWSSRLYVSTTIDPKPVIEIEPDTPLNLERAQVLIGDLKNLFILLMGRPAFVLRIEGTVAAHVKERGKPGRGKMGKGSCEVLFSQIEQQPVNGIDVRLLFPLSVLRDRFHQVLQNWIESLPKLRPVYEVFFGIFRSHRVHLQSHFVHLAQAVESFQRRTIGGLYLPDEQYQAIRTAVTAAAMEAISKVATASAASAEGTPEAIFHGLRDRLKNQIKYANEPSLRRRLAHVLDNLSNDVRAMICSKPSEFVSAVVNTRNYLTHLDDSSGENILENDQLLHALRKLEILILILLLGNVGITEAEVLERLRATARFELDPFELPPHTMGD